MESGMNPVGEITKVEKHLGKSELYDIYIDQALAYTVHENVLVKHRLLRGEIIDTRTALEIGREQELEGIRSAALRYLSHASRSRKELERRLMDKNYSPEQISEILGDLQAKGFLDDGKLAEQLAEQRVERQYKGRNFVRCELIQKGLEREHIEHAIGQIDPEREQESANRLAVKRWSQTKGEPRQKSAKISAFLLRRGYPPGVAYQAVKEARKQLDQEHRDDWEDDFTAFGCDDV